MNDFTPEYEPWLFEPQPQRQDGEGLFVLTGDGLEEMRELLRRCGYNFDAPHPECYRNFSYVTLAQILEPRAIPSQSREAADQQPHPAKAK